jgi:TRAP-type C4-dicarboxylate transport system permease small subunit
MNRSALPGRLRRIVLAVNTVGLFAFLVWLAVSGQRIFNTQEGVLYLLPCLPFFFVYAFLARGAGEGAVDEDGLDDDTHDKDRR